MKIMIMCGGQGKRLGELTRDVPKPLVKLHGKTVLKIKLEEYYRQGFREFIFCIGYKGDMIRHEVEQLDFDIKAEFSDAGEKAGILERIWQAKDLFDNRVLMTYGDTFTNLDLSSLVDAHDRGGQKVTIVTAQIKSPFGLVEMDGSGQVTYFMEKPVLKYYIGYAVIDKTALNLVPDEVLQMHDGEGLVNFYKILIAMNRLGAYDHAGLQITFNTPGELKFAEEALYRFYTNSEINNE
jgi:NDP-sugar pyrophosphorylase family protein